MGTQKVTRKQVLVILDKVIICSRNSAFRIDIQTTNLYYSFFVEKEESVLVSSDSSERSREGQTEGLEVRGKRPQYKFRKTR